jgi:hypothetical protein
MRSANPHFGWQQSNNLKPKLVTMKTLTFVVCSTVTALCLEAVSVRAQYVSPKSPGAANPTALAPAWRPPHTNAPNRLFVTSRQDGGPGSLRDAIAKAAPGDTILFALRCPATIVLSNTLVIAQDLSVLGPGPDQLAITRGGGTNTPNFRIFETDAGDVTLAGMTIKNGAATQFSPTGDLLGGGIYNYLASLTVSNCVITGNVAPSGGGGNGFGGGIFTDQGGSLTLLYTTVSDNQATYAGGGVCTFHATTFLTEGCTLSDNFAGKQGGGLNFQGLTGLIQNSTLSGNSTPPDGLGGSALLNITFQAESSLLTLTACTIARNSGSPFGAVQIAAVPFNAGLTNLMLSTLVGSNSSPNFLLDGTNLVFVSLGHNLDSDGTSGLVNGVNGDIVGTSAAVINPVIGPLDDNGGPTLTHALLPGSPALGTGSCVDATSAPLLIDQRTFPRPRITGCDIGAFENQAPTVVCQRDHHHERHMHHHGDGEHVFAIVDDPDGDALTVIWSVNGSPVQTNQVPATHPPHPELVSLKTTLGVGTNVVSISVSDGKTPAVTCSSTVVVRDTTPPKIIGILATPSALTPVDGRLVPVSVSVTATDAGGPVTSKIVSVSSNQPVGGTPDWVITGDLTLKLRAETTGHARRVYTITVQCSDPSGNKSFGTTQVIVPAPSH